MIELTVGPARVAFTLREDGDLGRTEPDSVVDADVRAARDGVRRACGVDAIAAGWQVHGARVATVTAVRPGWRVAAAAADGQVTRMPGVGVAVHVADCLPVAVAGAGGVAMLHVGWRGLAAGVLEAGVAALGLPLAAAIGPGAGGCCYEVGADVRAAFGLEGRGRLDLKAIARARLARVGVAAVEDVGICTLCAPAGQVFSHRRGATARQAGVAWLS
jgi:copper oxidase (laccase) domain-containing protein